MKDEHFQNRWRELLWRRKWTKAERDELRAQSQEFADLELETHLTSALEKMPQVPVASNFTARVMQAIDLEEKQATRSRIWLWNWHFLLPRVAVAMAVLLVAGSGIYHYETNSRRAQFAKNVAFVAQAQPMPSVEALKNFDAIQRMGQPVRADEDLLSLLQ